MGKAVHSLCGLKHRLLPPPRSACPARRWADRETSARVAPGGEGGSAERGKERRSSRHPQPDTESESSRAEPGNLVPGRPSPLAAGGVSARSAQRRPGERRGGTDRLPLSGLRFRLSPPPKSRGGKKTRKHGKQALNSHATNIKINVGKIKRHRAFINWTLGLRSLSGRRHLRSYPGCEDIPAPEGE